MTSDLVVDGRACRLGIDISNWQNVRTAGPIDYVAVATRCDFLWAKASEGSGFTDPFYQLNRDGWLATGRPFGAYHWLTPGARWQDQVERFLQATNNGAGCQFLVLDAEQDGITDDQVVNWARTVRTRTGLPVMIYHGTYTDPKDRSAGWLEFGPWLAAYGPNRPGQDPTQMRLPVPASPWGSWQCWQYTSKGEVPGIVGYVDLNVADKDWLLSVANGHVNQEEGMAPPYIQRTSNGHPHLIFEDSGIRVDLATLDGVTGENQVAAIKYVSGLAGDPTKVVVERPPITDPAGDFFIERCYSQVPGPITQAHVKAIADAVVAGLPKPGGDGGSVSGPSAQEIADAVWARVLNG